MMIHCKINNHCARDKLLWYITELGHLYACHNKIHGFLPGKLMYLVMHRVNATIALVICIYASMSSLLQLLLLYSTY